MTNWGVNVLACVAMCTTTAIINATETRGGFSGKPGSPFLGVGLDGGLVELGVLVFGLQADPVGMVPQLMLLQAHLGGKHRLAVRTAMTQLLCQCSLVWT